MISPLRASAFLQPILVILLGLFGITLVIGWLLSEEYEDDDFSVTITYSCERVLNERNYPPEVLTECLELRDEIKRRNNH